MSFVWSEKLRIGLAFVALTALGQSCLLAQTALSAGQIIQKAVARAQNSGARPSKGAYTYTKLTVMEEFDSSGKVKEHKEKVYQVNFRDGATYAKLVEVNGHAPGEADLKKQAENESNAQQMTGAKSNKAENRENFLTPEIVSRFDFTLVGQTNFNG